MVAENRPLVFIISVFTQTYKGEFNILPTDAIFILKCKKETQRKKRRILYFLELKHLQRDILPMIFCVSNNSNHLKEILRNITARKRSYPAQYTLPHFKYCPLPSSTKTNREILGDYII